MKVRAKVWQIIKWEEKDKYFFGFDYGKTVVDMVYLFPLSKVGAIMDTGVWHSIKTHVLGKKRPYSDIMFQNRHYAPDRVKVPTSWGLPILVERPHNFKEGDIIELDIGLKKVN